LVLSAEYASVVVKGLEVPVKGAGDHEKIVTGEFVQA
jgi:hypothetical protein